MVYDNNICEQNINISHSITRFFKNSYEIRPYWGNYAGRISYRVVGN